MTNHIILYSLNYAPEKTGIGKYNFEMVQFYNSVGLKTSVVCAPPYYPEWSIHKPFNNEYSKETHGLNTIYRCPLYVPKSPTIAKRILHLLSFSLSSILRLITLIKLKPDFIIVVQPTFFCVPIALIFSKIVGCKTILHIQDYELDAMFGLGLSKRDKIKKTLERLESFMLRKFDLVSSISNKMIEKAVKKGVDVNKIVLFPNWADTEFVTPDTSGTEFKQQLGYKNDDKIILYSGNIGNKQGLEYLIDAAVQLKNDKHFKFLIVGEGSYLIDIKNLVSENHLSNVKFLPLQEWADVPSLLSMADLHVVLQKFGAADSVLPSKLTNILSCGGHAIVTAEKNTELGLLEEKYPGIYTLIEPENSKLLKQAIVSNIYNSSNGYNKVARKYAEQFLNKEKILRKFLEDII